MAAEIKTGVTSWTEKSLVESGWYPKGTHTPEGRLRYYASQFSIVENDSMYYAIPPADRTALWVERTPPRFTMNVKAFASLTEHYTDAKRLPPELRDALPDELRDDPRVYPKDLGDELVREIAARFRAAVEPLRASGRLGLILFQYPVWFTASPENEQKLVETRELVPGCRVGIEFRNAIWMNEHHRDRTLALLREADLVYACVDEPQGEGAAFAALIGATATDGGELAHAVVRAVASKQICREIQRPSFAPPLRLAGSRRMVCPPPSRRKTSRKSCERNSAGSVARSRSGASSSRRQSSSLR